MVDPISPTTPLYGIIRSGPLLGRADRLLFPGAMARFC